MNRNSMNRNLRCKAVMGAAVALCLIVAQLDLHARPGTNDDGSAAAAESDNTSAAGAQPQPQPEPSTPPAPRVPRLRLTATSWVQIPSERVLIAQATTQAGATPAPAPPVQTGSSKKKWIIIAAAVAGGVTAGILLAKGKTEEDPVITLGQPLVGQP